MRVYTEERERSAFLLVDQRISMFFGSQRAMKSVVAAEVAALAAWRVLAVGDRLGALVFDDQRSYSHTPRRSRDAVVRLLSRLESCNAALQAGQQSHAGQLNTAMDTLARSLSKDALVIYVGDGYGWDDHSDEMLKRISLHNDVIAINVFDPAEVELPALDELVVSDGQMQIAVSGQREQLKSHFRSSFSEHVERMRAGLARFGLPLIEVDTVEDPLKQLLRALGATR